MDNCVVYQDQVPAKDMPGRALKWLFPVEAGVAEHCSMNAVTINPGNTVKPAHAHPDREEIIYITRGTGQVLLDGKVYDLRKGTAVLFPAGSIHMVRNNGDKDLDIICFFAPAATFDNYEFYEDVEFPEV